MMADSQRTRVAHLYRDIEREEAVNTRTRFAAPVPVFFSHRDLFNPHQAQMAAALQANPRPGVMCFALSYEHGLCGNLWLEASAALRSGTVGRHGLADLHLPWDDELSLRHLLVLVHRSEERVRLRVLDLKTLSGFRAEQGDTLQAVEADGPVILAAARYSLVLVPTGGVTGLPWDSKAENPWSTLPPRVLAAQERPFPVAAPRREITRVTRLDGPVEAGPGAEPLLEPGEPVYGMLVVGQGQREEPLPVGRRALSRGVLLGRYARCGVHASGLESVSRVHALLLETEGQLHLMDTGSTNGTWRAEQEVKCAPVEARQPYHLGRELSVRWEPVH